MQREIKFRVWNDTEKLFVTIGMNIRDSSLFWDSLNKDDYYIIQEYTGLKDKNGKEIYEGDIIQYFYKDNESSNKLSPYPMGWVYYEEGRYSVKNDNRLLLFCPKSSEVIGNIFENPDLIK